MEKVARTAVVILLALLSLAPTRDTQTIEYGYASAYAEGVMDATVRYRLDNDVWRVPPPHHWYTAHGYIAAMDCSRVGEMATMVVEGRRYRVLIADCAGDDGHPDRFADMGVILEMNWELWEKHKTHGVPLRVGLSK